jgi:hypothetical protein
LRRPEERVVDRQGKASIDSLFGVLKERRGMNQSRRSGFEEVVAQLFTQARQIQ